MKTTTSFDPDDLLIMVRASIAGPRRRVSARLALDTGAAATVIAPEVAHEAGYSERDAIGYSNIVSAVGQEQNYRVRLSKFTALGHTREQLVVMVGELAHHDEVGPLDGLVGLNFLNDFNYEVRSVEGLLVVDEVFRRLKR